MAHLWSSMSGKYIVFQAASILNFIAFAFFFTGFASPYWVQSWPRIFSGFKKIGLWEACFAGLVLPFDPRVKAYYGCWWIFAPEYRDMREFLMPWWFILTQLICTLVFIMLLLCQILHLALWMCLRRKKVDGVKRREPFAVVQILTFLTIINAVCMVFTVVLFGLAYYLDRDWMPHRQLNYLSWSYGVVIVATFFMIFASIAIINYNRMVRQEFREPGSMRTPLTATTPVSHTSPFSSPTSEEAKPISSKPHYPSTSHSMYPGSYSGHSEKPPVSSHGGYPSRSQSGYPSGSQSGYPSGSQSGYPSGSQSGYQSGYPGGSQSGYPGSSHKV